MFLFQLGLIPQDVAYHSQLAASFNLLVAFDSVASSFSQTAVGPEIIVVVGCYKIKMRLLPSPYGVEITLQRLSTHQLKRIIPRCLFALLVLDVLEGFNHCSYDHF
jgi:hypothetical protein